jgi:hypothetical protein
MFSVIDADFEYVPMIIFGDTPRIAARVGIVAKFYADNAAGVSRPRAVGCAYNDRRFWGIHLVVFAGCKPRWSMCADGWCATHIAQSCR